MGKSETLLERMDRPCVPGGLLWPFCLLGAHVSWSLLVLLYLLREHNVLGNIADLVCRAHGWKPEPRSASLGHQSVRISGRSGVLIKVL